MKSAIIFAALWGSAGSAVGANLLTNGDFESSNFSGWTWTPTLFADPFVTPTVVPFNTSGTGVSPAFRVNPGTDTSHWGINQEEGGTLSQSVSLVAGTSYDVKVGASAFFEIAGPGNVNAGRLRLFVGGQQLWDWDVDSILPGDTVRNSFSGTYTPAVSGNYTMELLFTRTYMPTIYHFVDNVSIAAVPEPGTVALFTLGLAGTLMLRRRHAN